MSEGTYMLGPADALEAALGGVEMRNGVLVPAELERQREVFAAHPALPPVTLDEVRLGALEMENIRLKGENERLRAVITLRELEYAARATIHLCDVCCPGGEEKAIFVPPDTHPCGVCGTPGAATRLVAKRVTNPERTERDETK